jgi:two-component system chemotaxis response regulator CheY
MMVNILCIDNSKTIRQVVKDCVLDLNYEFFEAKDGNTGIDLANSIDSLKMIIIDWNIPGFSGGDILNYFRSNDKFNNSLILVLIGIENKEDVIKAIGMGANMYILKPFSVSNLQDKIEEMIKNAA